jgi:hypothetical protein
VNAVHGSSIDFEMGDVRELAHDDRRTRNRDRRVATPPLPPIFEKWTQTSDQLLLTIAIDSERDSA